jgi:DNA-binding transcriptional ArsR family regulator
VQAPACASGPDAGTLLLMWTDAALKALAEPNRRAILHLVRDQPRSVTEIAEHFDITQQAISLHLKALREAGLVGVRRDGQRRLYRVDPDGMRSLQEFLDELWPAGLARLKHAVESDRPNRDTASPGEGTSHEPAPRTTRSPSTGHHPAAGDA